MESRKEYTIKQHYIPQVYLRGFSLEYQPLIDDGKKKHNIYFHNLVSEKQIDREVPVDTVCYEKELYEVTGNDGDVVLPNHLEAIFGVFERKFGDYRKKLEKKAFIKDNTKTKCFLTKEEKLFWATYIVVQILRLPQTLELAEEVTAETFEDVNEKQIKNIARLYTLPFFKEVNAGDKELILFDTLLRPMENMYWGIGVDFSNRIITSDLPVFIASSDDKFKEEYDRLIFPITSSICLFLYGKEDKKDVPKNFMFIVDDSDREEIFKSMSAVAYEKIYMNHHIDKKEKDNLDEIRIDREERVKICHSLT